MIRTNLRGIRVFLTDTPSGALYDELVKKITVLLAARGTIVMPSRDRFFKWSRILATPLCPLLTSVDLFTPNTNEGQWLASPALSQPHLIRLRANADGMIRSNACLVVFPE